MNIFRGNLARRITFSFVALALLAVIAAVGSILVVQYIDHTLSSVVAQADIASQSSRIRSESLTLTDLGRRYIQLGAANREKHREAVTSQQYNLKVYLLRIDDLLDPNNAKEHELFSQVEQRVVAFNSQVNHLMDTYDSERALGPATNHELAVLLTDYEDPLTNAIRDFETFESTRARGIRDQAQQRISRMIGVLVAVAVLALLGMALMVQQAIQRIVTPLIQMRAGVEAFQRGQLDKPVPVSGRDEMGGLSQAFNTMATQLQQRMHTESEARQALQKLNQELEQRVALRTRALEDSRRDLQSFSNDLAQANAQLQAAFAQSERRARLLEASAQVSHAAAMVRDPDTLLPQAMQLISERFGFYHVGLFLVDDHNEWAVLRSAHSEGGQAMLARGHRLRIGDPDQGIDPQGVVGWTAQTGQPRVALDVGEDAVHFDNPLLPDTRSEIALPLRVADRTLGVLDVQSTQEAAFGEEDITVLNTLADQFAITLESAQLFQQTQMSLKEAQEAYRHYVAQEWASHLGEGKLQTQEYAVDPTLLVDGSALPEVDLAYEQGRVLALNDLSASVAECAGGNGHTARAALVAPIKLRDQVIGALDLRETNRERQWTEDEIALTDAVASQVALAVENARLFEQTQDTLADTRALYQASARINSATTIDEILAALRDHTVLGQADVFTALNVFDTPWTDGLMPKWLDVAARWTPQPAENLASRYDLAQYPAIHFLRASEPLVINDIESDPRLDESARHSCWQTFQGRSVVIIPLVVGELWIGFVDAVLSQPAEYASSDLQRLMSLAGQASAAIQTRRLFEQTQARVQQLAVLNEISRAASSVMETERLFGTLYEQIQHIMDVGAFYVGLYDSASNVVTYPVFYDEALQYDEADEVLQPGTRTHRVITSGEPLLIALTPAEHVQESRQVSHAMGNVSRASATLAYAPLKIGDRVTGLLSVQSYKFEAYTQEQMDLLSSIANQVAVAVENARLFQEARARALQLATASEAGRAATSILDLDELLRSTVDLVRARFGYYQASIFLLDKTGQFAIFRETTSEAGKRLIQNNYQLSVGGQSLIGWVTSMGRSRVLRATDTDTLFIKDTRWPTAQSELAIPLKRGDQVVGALGVQSNDLHAFRADEVTVLELLADQISIAIQNARLYGQTREQSVVLEKRAADLAAVNEVSRLVTQTLDQNEILNTAVRVLVSHFDVGHVAIALLTPARNALRIAAERPDQGTLGMEIPLTGAQVAREYLGSKTAFAVDDVMTDPRTELLRQGMLRFSVRSAMFLPLVIQGESVGFIRIDAIGVMRRFSEEDLSLGQTLASQVAVALQNARLFEETRRRAKEVQQLYEIGGQLNSTLELRPVMQLVADAARELVGSDESLVFVQRGTELYENRMSPAQTETSPSDSGDLTETIMRTGRLIYIPDTTTDLRSSPDLRARGVRSQIGLPIRIGNRTIGVLFANSNAPNDLNQHAQELLSFLSAQAATAIQNSLLYEEQKETAEKLREVDRLKTEFLASMSHELRTPLNSIIGFSRVILKGIDGPLSDLQKQDLEAIHGSGQHLLGLINNILDISKIEAGKMELAFEEVDMKQTIKTVMSTAIGLNKGKPVELKTDIPEDLPTVWADQTRSRQVLLNLVSNASKFTEQGTITCTATYNHQFVTIGVRDTGIGIPSDKLSMIFDEFTQVDASTTRKYGGTGLGLAITRRFVEMHGGKIWVESEEGHGATFYFTLPRAQVAALPPEEPQKQAQRLLLAVDDDPGVITLYKRYMEKQDYQVIGVTDSRQAVEQAIRLKPDVISVDILMPNKDGWSVIQELRHTPETKDIPVVVCSITSDQGKGFSLGAADYLVKPITEDDLRGALKRLDGRNQSNVLIIDDTPEDIRLIRRILEAPRTPGDQHQAYFIHEASNGALGIEAVHQNQPDLIILDLMMPEVDGFAVLGALKADPQTRHIPIVVVTAKTLTEQDHQRLNGHIEALLSKGLFSEQELMEHVAMALSKALEAKRPESPGTSPCVGV